MRPTLSNLAVILIALLSSINSQPTHPHSNASILQQNPNSTCTQPISLPNTIILGNCQNQLYTMAVQIGTPGQYLTLVVDIQEINQTNSEFKPLESNSFQLSNEVVALEFNNGQTYYGNVGEDVLVVNQSSIQTKTLVFLFDVPLAIVNQYTPFAEEVDGLIGLGISPANPNLLQIAYNQGQISSTIFALALQPNSNASYLYYGEIPEALSINTTFVKSFSQQGYEIRILGFFIQGNQYQADLPENVVLSTTNPYFSLTKSIYNTAINHYFKSCLPSSSQPYMICNCNEAVNWPTFTIMLAGVQIYLQPKSNIIYLQNNTCSFGFNYTSDSQKHIVLGLSFFYNYNVTFDLTNRRVGLQGNLTALQQVGQNFLIVSQYVMCAGMLGLALFALFLIWHMKLMKEYKPAIRFIEIGKSDRFLEN